MVIGVLKEIKGNEYRVAAVPATVHEIVRHGHTVYVETGAGVGSGFSDAQYEAAGAIIADTNTVWEKADLYYKVKELFPQEFKWMNKDKILFTYIHSNAHPDSQSSTFRRLSPGALLSRYPASFCIRRKSTTR